MVLNICYKIIINYTVIEVYKANGYFEPMDKFNGPTL